MMKQAFETIPTWLKIVATVAAVGVLFGQQWAGLPNQVASADIEIAAVKARVLSLEGSLDRIDGQYTRLICLLSLPEDVRVRLAPNPFALERECGR